MEKSYGENDYWKWKVQSNGQFGGIRIFIPVGVKVAERIRGFREEMNVQEQKSPLGEEERRWHQQGGRENVLVPKVQEDRRPSYGWRQWKEVRRYTPDTGLWDEREKK